MRARESSKGERRDVVQAAVGGQVVGWRAGRVSAIALSLALVMAVSWVAMARADYEQVPGHFGVSGEEEQL